MSTLSPDLPVHRPEDDALGYAPFARALAASIVRMAPADGLVLAVHGPWGSGKSTTLNLVAHYLAEAAAEKEAPVPPLVLRFNPWWFSGREDLTRLFLVQLRARLGDKDYGEVKARLADFADLLSKIPLPGSEAGGFVADKLRELPDLVALKDKVDGLLRERGQTILVIIDDIDRLTGPEVRDLFRAIKAVGHFPRVVYLLAFDKDVVARVLEGVQGGSGQAYLEKIVQVPFELPPPDRGALRRLLFSKLNEILADTPEADFDQSYWENVYLDGIDPFIRTPRDVVRLANVLRVTYPAVHGEVNPVDFIALEALRVFSPAAYDVVRSRPDLFTGFSSSSFGDATRMREGEEKEHEAWLNTLPEQERDRVRRLLRRVFPRFASALGGMSYGSDFGPQWRRARLARSEEVFPVYFRLAVPEGGVSHAEVQALLALVGDTEAFGQALLRLADELRPDGSARLRPVLQRFADHLEDEVPAEHAEPVVRALVRHGDRLIRDEDEPRGFFDLLDTDLLLWFLVRDLLRSLPPPERSRVLNDAVQHSVSPSVAVAVAWRAILEHDESEGQVVPPEERLAPAGALDVLKSRALDVIRKAAQAGTLLDAPYLVRTLYRWKEWSTEEEVRAWARTAVESDDGLLHVLHAFKNTRRVMGMGFAPGEGDVTARSYVRLDPKSLEPFLDPVPLVDRARTLADAPETPAELTEAAKQFVEEADIRASGGDPEEVFERPGRRRRPPP